jgi:hypothetical protein
LITNHRFITALFLTLSAQLPLVATYAADTWSYNGAVALTSSSYNVNKAGGSVTLTAVRVGGDHGALSVSYGTANETAVAGAQFTAASGTLTWANGDASTKSITIPILNSAAFTTGTKYFSVRLTAVNGTILGSPDNANVNIAAGTTTVTKSIRQWVSCSESIDESAQLEAALNSAANHAFTLIIDCPVRFHSTSATLRSIAVPDGVTISFQGTGEFLVVSSGPPALTVAHPAEASFVDWNLTFL